MSLRSRTWLTYFIVLALFVAGMVVVLHAGAKLSAPAVPNLAQGAGSSAPASPTSSGIWQPLVEHLRAPFAVLLLQIIVIVAFARLVGALFRRLGQPSVIGEMLAGILLGPSLLGWTLPDLQAWIFPADSLGALRLLSQVGVILFMFVVGVDLDVGHLREKADAALLVSHVSIVCPFLLGSAAALAVYREYAPEGVPFVAFALFLGVSMSITAFPVLARIIEERQLGKTVVGTTAIACAAVDDATAWCVLAVIVAIVRAGSLGGAALTVGLAVAFVLAMWLVAGPALARMRPVGEQPDESRARRILGAVLIFVFASSLVTEAIGIHALFGAFLAGVVMPAQSGLRRLLKDRLETFSTTALLPLFFAFTGLRTEIGLVSGATAWLVTLGLIAVAIAGKLGASTLAARWTGLSWPDAAAVGSLMNTRGLVELIVLNLGLDLGILSPRIFAMLVIMALVTTMMTGPLLSAIDRWRERRAPSPA
jgi:Kef-type K+ transport system membrane component KefB